MENSTRPYTLKCVFEKSFQIRQENNSCLFLPNAIVNLLLSALWSVDCNQESSSFLPSDHDLESFQISSMTCRKCSCQPQICISRIQINILLWSIKKFFTYKIFCFRMFKKFLISYLWVQGKQIKPQWTIHGQIECLGVEKWCFVVYP